MTRHDPSLVQPGKSSFYPRHMLFAKYFVCELKASCLRKTFCKIHVFPSSVFYYFASSVLGSIKCSNVCKMSLVEGSDSDSVGVKLSKSNAVTVIYYFLL